MPKIIVAHPHQQHSYQLAIAMYKIDYLFQYVTTVYFKYRSLTYLCTKLLKSNDKIKAETRYCKLIPDEKVKQICEIEGLCYLLLMRLTHNNKHILNKYNHFVSVKFGSKLAKYAVSNNVDAVICYDGESTTLFRQLKQKNPKIIRVLDVSAANKLFLRQIYEDDMIRLPEFSSRLKNERCDIFDENVSLENAKLEIEDANYFLVPSHFVSESLRSYGVSENQILYCPYGVDLKLFQEKKYLINAGKPLKVIYVGGVKQLKGIGYLLKAFQIINPNIAKLTIVGNYDKSSEDIKPYIQNITFTGMVLHKEIPLLLQESDIFIFPSLGDSFGLAALEAGACGLPLILSENTGMKDYISDGVEGFIIPVGSIESIVEKIIWFNNNREMIEIMGRNARNMAKKMTWDNYYINVENNIKKILENNHHE